MELNRREFVIAAAATACGCQGSASDNGPATNIQPAIVDAGAADDYATPGIHDNLKNSGFFVVNQAGALAAISSVCTHRNCRLRTGNDHNSFYCKCHGSTFDINGHVTEGPAVKDLPHFDYVIDAQKRLSIHVGMPAR